MPYQPMYRPDPRQGQNMLQLIMEQGRARADAADRSAQIWSGALQGVGQTLAGGIMANAAAKEEQRGKDDLRIRDSAWIGYVESGEWQQDPTAAYATARKIWGPGPESDRQFQGLQAVRQLSGEKRDPAADQKALGNVLGAMEDLDDAGRARLYPQAAALTRRVYPEVQLEPEYNPDRWKEYSAIGAQLRGDKPKEPIKARPGDVFLDPETHQQIAAIPDEVKPETRGIDVQAAEAAARGDTETYNRLLRVKKEMGQADDRPPGAGGDPVAEAKRKRLVDAVFTNPALWDDLTSTDKGDIAADLNARGFSGFGKRMTDGAIGKISESKAAISSLRDLRTTLQENEQYIGPVAGLSALNPYSEAVKAQSKIDLVRQRVGKALEGGVLRKEDEEKYKKILSTLRDEPTTAIYKVDNLIATLERDMELFIEEQRAAGRRSPQAAGPLRSGQPAPPLGRPDAPPAGGPKVGEVVRGYRYKGGNPADPSSWEKP